jgi:cytochrome c oxidase cbb3-type subunit 3
MRIGALALVVVALVGGAAALAVEVRAGRLMRLDPDAIPHNRSQLRAAAAAGRGVFESHCAGCHGATGQGDPKLGAPDLTDADWLYGSGQVSEIETIIRFGVRAPNARTWKLAEMPAYGRPHPYPAEPALQSLSPGDIGDVTAYLLKIEGRPADALAAARGGAIYGGRGGCYDCHGPDGHGDPGIGAPNLTDKTWLYGDGSPSAIAASITYGRAGFCPAWTGRLSASAIRRTAVYVYTLAHPGALQGRL